MDFVTDLPSSQGFDAILVVVYRLSKMAHFVPRNKAINTEQTAELLFGHVFKLHSLPDKMVSDRGTQFASRFWKRLFELLGTQTRLSTAVHPQTDGQSERVNQCLEQYLRCYVGHDQSNWASLSPLAEFVYNNSLHASIKTMPFMANYGFNPRLEVRTNQSIQVPSADHRAAQLALGFERLEVELSRAQMTQKNMPIRRKPRGPTSSRACMSDYYAAISEQQGSWRSWTTES
jgi:hypothetical protein